MIADELPLVARRGHFRQSRCARRYQLGLVSMSSRYGIDYVFERTGLGPMFAVVVSAEDVPGTHKPDPYLLQARTRTPEREAARGAQAPAAAR